MNLTSPSQVKAWCIARGFHPNRTLGQNFLVDRNALEAILGAADLVAGESVLEVGPGLGVLTEGLLARGCRVTAIEKDPALASRLAEALGSPADLTVLEGDALDRVADGACDGFDAMVSNLPYQAGTRILLDLTRRADREAGPDPAAAGRPAAPPVIVALLQTEVAERLAAGPGSKTRGMAGVWAQLDYDVSIVRKVSPTCFWPRPEIGSSVVKLVRHHRRDGLTARERQVFRTLVKRAFEHRRKQLGTVFRGLVESTARAEDLSNGDWISLSSSLAQCAEI